MYMYTYMHIYIIYVCGNNLKSMTHEKLYDDVIYMRTCIYIGIYIYICIYIYVCMYVGMILRA